MPASYIFDHENSNYRQQKLQQLLQQAYQQNQNWQLESLSIPLQEIVELVLRSRPICRQYNGQMLSGIYLEIYQEVQAKLLKSIAIKIQQFNSLPSTLQWLYTLQYQAFRITLDDLKLKKLALAAQQTLPNSGLRSHALQELIKAIKLSQRLIKLRYQGLPTQFDKLVYEEAVTETLVYVCTKIELYDPERGNKKFMNWVNFQLEKNLIKCRQQFRIPHTIEIPFWSDWENFVHQPNQPNLSDLLYKYIEQDENNIFKSVFIKNHPQANFRQIALGRLSGHTWQEIAQELKISIPTLSSFFQRNCQKFKALFEKEFKS
ncbi:MAG TPA: hypothetical protein ACFCUY_09075 [Xenococcaceae cyanobacterium]|jgi:DNA-directed RNA polymerase specialized sigma24 family protein